MYLSLALPNPSKAAAPVVSSTRNMSSVAKTGTSAFAVAAAKSPLLLQTQRARLLSTAQHPRVKQLVEYLWRETARFGSGSTGAMIRIEQSEGVITSVSGTHVDKAVDSMNTIKSLLKGNHGELGEIDRKILFEIIEDLTTGTGINWTWP